MGMICRSDVWVEMEEGVMCGGGGGVMCGRDGDV